MPGPDFSNSATIYSVLTFIPGILVGFIGFLVFGTTSTFRQIYAVRIRDYVCCCGCVSGGGAGWSRRGRRGNNHASSSSSSSFREIEDGRSWQAMGNGRGRVATYHCRIESAALGEVELTKFGRVVGKKGSVARAVEAPANVQQPWKTLGIDPPEGRQH